MELAAAALAEGDRDQAREQIEGERLLINSVTLDMDIEKSAKLINDHAIHMFQSPNEAALFVI